MSKKEFLSKLKVKLTKYEDKGVEKVIQFYTEIIDDKLEMGMTEREAVDSLGEMDDIVESLMVDLVERTDKAPEKKEPIYYKTEYIEPQPQPICEPSSKHRKQDRHKKAQSQPTSSPDEKIGYDIFHDYDLVGKKDYKLNKALNRRFNCGYKFVIYSILHYIAVFAKLIFGVTMSLSALAVFGGSITVAALYADTIGKVMLAVGCGILASAVVMITMLLITKIIGLFQDMFHTIMRGSVDKRVREMKYESKY